MKKHSAVLGVVVAAFMAGRISVGVPASAESDGGAGAASVVGDCADLNADGRVDVSDPVHLLRWLFNGGPAPVCPEPTPTYPDCAQDPARFVDNGDGTVTDSCLGLMWQKGTADVNGDGRAEWGGDGLDWAGAAEYVEGLEFAGYDDWRLPSVRELTGIVDLTQTSPAYFTVFDGERGGHWTATPGGGGRFEQRWRVEFEVGLAELAGSSGREHLRAVRDLDGP